MALEVAQRGGKVHMVCRNPQSGQEAKDEIQAAAQTGDVRLHHLDLSVPRDVLRFAREFVLSEPSLDCLVNNAGCMINTREVKVWGGFFFLQKLCC